MAAPPAADVALPVASAATGAANATMIPVQPRVATTVPAPAPRARPQRRKTPEQVKALEELFFGPTRVFSPKVRATQDLIAKAVAATGLTAKQIRQWFQYKRQKAKPGHRMRKSGSPYTIMYKAIVCSAHKKLFVLAAETTATRILRCRGVSHEGGMQVCISGRVKPVSANMDLIELFRGWTPQQEAVTPQCPLCENPVVTATPRNLSSCWQGVELPDMEKALLTVCKAGHVMGQVVIPPVELDLSMAVGYRRVYDYERSERVPRPAPQSVEGDVEMLAADKA